MKRVVLVFAVVLGAFAVLSDSSADLNPDSAALRENKEFAAHLGGRSVKPGVYRSPAKLRKVTVSSDDQSGLQVIGEAGGSEIADYGSFKLYLVDEHRLAFAEQGREPASNPGPRSLTVRDDFNVLLLRSGAIDTTDTEAGSFVGLGGHARLAGTESRIQPLNPQSSSDLRIVQFVGPVKRAWIERLNSSGLEIIAYVPNNAFLVRGAGSSSLLASAAADYDGGGGFIQWEGAFEDAYKVHPALVRLGARHPSKSISVAVQFAPGTYSPAEPDIASVQLASETVLSAPYHVGNFGVMRVRVRAGRISSLAALPTVINIEPWEPPQLADERSAQIIAGALTADGKEPSGPGYMAWLASRGFTSNFDFAIDVADSGVDRGSLAAASLHPDFLDHAGQSRVAYARDYTSEQDGADANGHGTINLSIAGGSSTSNEKDMRDGGGFNHGLGIAPFARLGSSKIFQDNGRFDLIEPFTKLVSEAYADGARISSNSWGSGANEYTIDAQEYDTRTRDAVPSQQGNQEMVFCFAAGNAGPGGRIISPSSGKNVISVGASENVRTGATDGCSVRDTEADSAHDMAFFSSGGPLFDGRIKPDISAPGTHVQGAATQHADFIGDGVCGVSFEKPFFPEGQTLYTWSSGTSHSTPQVAGAAALLWQFFRSRGITPSAALVKAALINTTTYMTGEGAGGNLPHVRQGWGLLALGRAFDPAAKIFVNQTHTFTESGEEFLLTGVVSDPSRPFRVTLAWSDAPGLSSIAPWVNDLDLEVIIGGRTYRGNTLIGDVSQPDGEPDTKNNVEGVYLPAGVTGVFAVRIRARNIAGDGVPGNATAPDQDFALVIYNGEEREVAVPVVEEVSPNGTPNPGGPFTFDVSIRNISDTASGPMQGTLRSLTSGVTPTAGVVQYPPAGPGSLVNGASAFGIEVGQGVACGENMLFELDVVDGAATSTLSFALRVGSVEPIELFEDDIESGEGLWTHGSGIKKKKKRIDTWKISQKRFLSGGSSWFTPAMAKQTDGHLDSPPIDLPANGRDLTLTFHHTFEFERGAFDGGVLEISTGGAFEDLGPQIVKGGYNGTVLTFVSNPLAGREGWVEGRLGQFQQVVVDLSPYAGKRVVIRFRVGTDLSVKGPGWYVDDVRIAGVSVSCDP